MNQLNKLIEQYERENPGKKAAIYDGKEFGGFEPDFVLWLASRPACGKEQRLFLDELEKRRCEVFPNAYIGGRPSLNFGQGSTLRQDDFEADLHKVSKGE